MFLHYIHQNDYANIAIMGAADSENGQGRHSLEGHGSGQIHSQAHHLPQGRPLPEFFVDGNTYILVQYF